MRLFFLLLFIAVPLIELMLLIKVGEIIGVLPTILLVIATAVIGVSLLKRQGLAALTKARTTLEAGEFPVESVVDGACLLVAGAFLLTPGLLTDTVGFALLVPAFRRQIAHWLFDKLSGAANINVTTFGPDGPAHPHGRSEPREPGRTGAGPTVIDGEYEDLEKSDDEGADRPNTSSGSSPWRR